VVKITQVKFFTSSIMNLEEMEEKINEFCKKHEIIKVDMIEISELIIIMVVYK